jgi:hypothetical protein
MTSSPGNTGHADIIQMLSAILTQMMSNYQGLQDQIIQNDLHLSAEFQNVVQDNAIFKQDVQVELDASQNLLTQPNISSNCSPGSVPFLVSSSTQVSPSASISPSPVTSNLPTDASSSMDL